MPKGYRKIEILIRRNRYMIIDEAFTDEKSKKLAIQNLKNRVIDLKVRIENMLYEHKLELSELNNDEYPYVF